MRNRTALLALALLSLVAAACGKTKNVETEQTPNLPSISIGDCVTKPDVAVRPATPKGEDYKTQLKQQGTLNIGSDIAFPPFESVDPATNQPVGFDIDLGSEIAKRLGLTPKFTNTSFDALFTQSLPQGQFDIGISGITIKPSRQGSVDFTLPYFKADLSLVVRTDSTIKTIQDLAGKVIGAQAATTGADCADAIKKVVGAKDVKTYDTTVQAFDALGAGQVEAVVNDLPVSRGLVAARSSSVKIVQVILTQEVYGIAIGKQKPDLRAAVNKALKDMFNDGGYDKIFEKWFKTPKPPYPLPPTPFPE
jgi:ABC-type amino acid transport substrate-binding protein